jgi:UDP-GlcNAc:undecaprenyl-phosphate GlcNAc-1-phosphate transferase
MIYKHLFTVLVISFSLAFVLTPLYIKIANRLKIFDMPDKRKLHRAPTPTLGGIVIYFSFSITILITSFLLRQDSNLELLLYLPGILIGSLVLVIFGILHDTREMAPPIKLFGQIMVALIIFFSGIRIESVTNPFGGQIELFYPLSLLVTVIWIVALINAINLIDGLDGLAAGITAIASLVLFFISLAKDDISSMFLCLVLFGSCLGFLRYNFYPAKIFMGDTGSMFLGLILGIISIQGINKMAITVALMIPITVLAIPIYDTALSIFRRFISKKDIFKPDREHIHYRLLNMGITHRHVVLLLYFICIYFGILAFLFILIPIEFAFILLVLLTMGVFMGIKAIGFIERRVKSIR